MLSKLIPLLALPFSVHVFAAPASTRPLQWSPCDLDFPEKLASNVRPSIECVTLEVPLDYSDPDSEPLQLQLVRAKADKQPAARGTMIFAPGGPGVSGVEEVAQYGHVYSRITGGEYDVVGFDTRGVGRTMPFVCNMSLVSQATERRRSEQPINQTVQIPSLDMFDLFERKQWHDGELFADACYQSNKETGEFYSTAFIARDMLRIVDALGEDGQLRLWGRSYGTILGQTFAAMFPERVDRMLLDSVVLPADYYSGLWATATLDADDALAHFLQDCIDVGPQACPLANHTGEDTTVHSIMTAVADVFRDLRDRNVTLPTAYPSPSWMQAGGRPLVSELKSRFHGTLYKPVLYPAIMSLVNMTLARDFSVFAQVTVENTPPVPEAWSLGTDAFHAIACSDSPLRASTADDMHSVIETQTNPDSMFTDSIVAKFWPCANWKFDAKERYRGRFDGIETKHPVMFVSGAFDPITPLSGAWQAASGFRDSRLLKHMGHGHGVSNHPSLCTIRAIAAYFTEGTLPSVDASCEPHKTGFEIAAAGAVGNASVSVDDVADEAERETLRVLYEMILDSSLE